AHAEAGRERGAWLRRLAAKVRDRRLDVADDVVPADLLEMRLVIEVVGLAVRPRGPAEVVHRDRGDAALGEARRELLEERVEAAHVRQDQDSRARALLRPRDEHP